MNEMNLMNNEELMMEEPMVETVIEPEMIQEEQEEKGIVLPMVLGAAAIGAGVLLYKKVVEPKLIDMATNYLAKKKAQMEEVAVEVVEESNVTNVDFDSEVK